MTYYVTPPCYNFSMTTLTTNQIEKLKNVPDGELRANIVQISSLGSLRQEHMVEILGFVTEIREVKVKKGRRAGEFMAIVILADISGSVEFISFPDHYKEFSSLLKSGSLLVVRAQLEFEDEKPKLMCGEVMINNLPAVEKV